MKWFLRFFLAAGLILGVWLPLSGCRKPMLKVPSDGAFRASIEGATVHLGEVEINIAMQNMSGFRVVAVYQEPKVVASSAVVHFRLAGDERTYTIDGVISYERNDAGDVLNPYFEVNEFKVEN
jgi:hypothetical protein